MGTVWRLLIAAALPCGSCSANSAPNANTSKRDIINVSGVASIDISLKLFSRWQTTSSASGCRTTIGLGVSAPLESISFAKLTNNSSSHPNWDIFRDAFVPGRCGWMMKSIEVFTDPSDSPLKINRSSNIPNRIAYVLSPSELSLKESWANNSDANKPVHLYCDFASLRKLDTQKAGSLTLALVRWAPPITLA